MKIENEIGDRFWFRVIFSFYIYFLLKILNLNSVKRDQQEAIDAPS